MKIRSKLLWAFLQIKKIQGNLYYNFCLVLILLLISELSFGQGKRGGGGTAGKGAAGISSAEQAVRSYFEGATKLILAIGAIVGLIGAIKVYSKWNSGDPDTGKVAASWFGSCVFLVVVSQVLKAFFLD